MGSSRLQALRVLREPGCTGSANMRRDTALLQRHDADTPATLRLYTWNPPAVSLGFLQRSEHVLDLEACAAAGIDVVQRPTGGRAVLHWQEVTYALVASTEDARFGGSLGESHGVIGEAIAAALQGLGIAATLSRPSHRAEGPLSDRPCFVSSGRAEIMVGGRKLVGSAQRRAAHAFLQHGSLLLGPAHLRLAGLLRGRTDPARTRQVQRRLQRTTTNVEELLGRTPSFDEMADALVVGFCDRLRLRPVLEERPLS